MISISQIIKNKETILGRNERQLEYIRKNNLKKSVRIADDKVLTKKILHKASIPVPKTLGHIKNSVDLEKFNFDSLDKSFVLKPVKGLMGAGIEIFYNRDKKGKWIRSDGSRLSVDDLKASIRDILDGKYSLFNQPDAALIEERIKPHKNFKYYTYKGTPDIRVLVYNKIPLMSYIRIPTKASNGKANLDLGAIGAGVDMAVGKTTHAIIGKATPIEYVPDTNISLSGLKIPYWDRILRYAIEASKATGLGFGAIDFLIDREAGPYIVEINARPGLSIQLSNNDGLKWRMEKARGLKVKTTERAIRLAKDLFGGEIEDEIEQISGKKVIGLIEEVTLYSIDDQISEKISAKIDTGADSTSIDTSLARKLGFGDAIDYAEKIISEYKFQSKEEAKKYSAENELNKKLEEHPLIVGTSIISSSSGINYRIKVNVNLEIDGVKFETKANIFDRSKLGSSVLIGNKSLGKFLIDPAKK